MKAMTLLCIIGFCLGAFFSGSAMAATLFFDDFEAGLDNWPVMPTLAIEEDPEQAGNNVLAFDTTADSTNVDALFLEGNENLEDYTMRGMFNIVGETANYAVAAFIARAQSTTVYVSVEPAVNRQGVAGIVNIFDRGAGWAIVGSGEMDLEMNKWYELSVTVEGTNFSASIDGELVAEFDDVPYPAGGYGIRQWASKALYDDIEVYDTGGSDVQPVEPMGKLTSAWGALKAGDL